MTLKKSLNLFFNQPKLIFFLILIIALTLRLTGVDWDQGHHLHPDERFLNMLVADISLPTGLKEYLDPARSPLNPRNNHRDFYVYGNAPITLSKIVSESLGKRDLHEICLIGRALSALADSAILLIIYKTAQLLEKNLKKKSHLINKDTKLWACLVYALLVLPIQQSHFFTTDTFLNLFTFTCFYFAIKFYFHQHLLDLIFSAVFFGVAFGSKISAVLFLPLILALIVLGFLKNYLNKKKRKNQVRQIKSATGCLFTFFFVSYFFLRLTSPYLFTKANFLNPTLSPEFIQNLKELRSWEGNDVWFPPAIQWINRPVTFGITNLAIFGMGLPAFIFSVWGGVAWGKKTLNFLKKTSYRIEGLMLASILLWVLGFLGYYAFQFAKTLRYFLPILPIISIIAGLGLSRVSSRLKLNNYYKSFLILGLATWPLMFLSIYIQPHSRIQASTWIYNNIPANSMILTEYWDDNLPLYLSKFEHHYQIQQLPVFNPDDQSKWQEMDPLLDQADYYILSSNRAWGSIPRVPKKYPIMSRFYQDLFDGKTDYQVVAKFSSHPSLEYLGIPISFDDSWAEEAFTVFDHPEVMIFKHK